MSSGSPHSLAELRLIAEGAYDWESWIAADGKVRWVNPSVARLTGYTPAECLAMKDFPMPLVVVEDREWVADAIALACAGSSGNDLDLRIRRKDGTIRHAAMSWRPLSSEQDLGCHVSIRDVSRRRRREDRTTEARRVAVDSNRAKDLFLANLSHEIRSPLQCILGGTEQLRDAKLAPAHEKWLNIIEEQASVMLRQVEDLLHFVHADAAPALRVRPTDLACLCHRAIEAIAPRLRTDAITTSCEIAPDVPRWVSADPDRLNQILGNILSNSTKFTFRGSISLRCFLDDQRRTILTVRDTGTGINASALGSVREPFFQAPHGIASASSGVGLGLSVVDRLVRQMGGKLTLESVVGDGTTVRVVLPLEPITTLGHGREPAEAKPAKAMDVLVVDDSEPSREVAVAMLAALGCRSVATPCAERAVEMVRAQPFDLVLLDYRLHGTDGISAARGLREAAAASGRTLAIVLFTADTSVETDENDSDQPIDMIVRKPLRTRQLGEILATIANGGRSTTARADKRARGRRRLLLDMDIVQELRNVGAPGKTLFDRLTRKVMASVATMLAQLDAMRDDLHSPAAILLAHRAKGDCLTLGARAAAQAASALETGMTDRSTFAPQLLDLFVTCWLDTCLELQVLIGTDDVPHRT